MPSPQMFSEDDKYQIAIQYNDYAKTFSEEVINYNKNSNLEYYQYLKKWSEKGKLKDKFILDLGCGTGDDLEELRKISNGCAITFGIDASEEMVRYAKEKNPNTDIKIGLFAKIPFPDNFFDIVISKWALQTAFDIDPIYKEISRVLKKDGKLLYLAGHPHSQFLAKQQQQSRGSDYFKQEIVKLTFFDGKMKVEEPSHTLNDFLTPTFLKNFSLYKYHEAPDSCAEKINDANIANYFIIKATRK